MGEMVRSGLRNAECPWGIQVQTPLSVGLDRSRYMSLERERWVTDTKEGMMMGPGREQKAGDFCEGCLASLSPASTHCTWSSLLVVGAQYSSDECLL